MTPHAVKTPPWSDCPAAKNATKGFISSQQAVDDN